MSQLPACTRVLEPALEETEMLSAKLLRRSLAAAALVACGSVTEEGGTRVGTTSAAVLLTDPVLNSAVERPQSQGKHYFELYGNFQHLNPSNPVCMSAPYPGTSLSYPGSAQVDSNCYTVDVRCNGALIDGSSIVYVSQSQINVAFPARPTGSICTFQVRRLEQGDPGGPPPGAASAELWPGAPSVPQPIAPPWIEITGSNDRGVNPSDNFHYLELFGYFPGSFIGDFSTNIWCNGTPITTAKVTGWVSDPGQVNVAFYDPAPVQPAACTIQISRNDGGATPLWLVRLTSYSYPQQDYPQPPTLPSQIGAYYWGGLQAGRLQASAGLTAQLGVTHLRESGINGPVRLVIEPKQRTWSPSTLPPSQNAYGISNYNFSTCPTGSAFLGCVARLSELQNAFSAAGPAIILTTMDSTSSGDYENLQNYRNYTWMISNSAAVKSEYYQLAKALYQTQTGKGGKTFIVSNWEGDNLLYCGSSYKYINTSQSNSAHQAWLSDCGDAQHQPSPDFSQEVAALQSWFQARHDAVTAALSDFGAQYPDVRVYDAIEFNSYKFIKDCGGLATCPATIAPNRFDVLHDIIPYVHPNYVSYSSWESSKNGRMDEDLAGISAYINSLTTPPSMILGEWGRDAMNGAGGDRWIFQELAKAVGRANQYQYAITYLAYETTDLQDGLLSFSGAENPSMTTLRNAAWLYTSGNTSTMSIRGVTEGSPRVGWTRSFQLYGTFPSSTVTTSYQCTDIAGNLTSGIATWLFQNTGQLNISISSVAPETELWCTFTPTQGRLRGAAVGPINSCAWKLCTRYGL